MAASEAFPEPAASGDAAARLMVLDAAADILAGAPSLQLGRLQDCQALVVSKTGPGLDAETIAALRGVIGAAAAARLGRPKYLVLDFAAPSGGSADAAPEGFDELTGELGNLVLKAPVVPVALVRAPIGGADLELALTCSMVLAETTAVFDFDADPLQALGLYGLLAHKIGFVRAERLMERGHGVSAAEMKDLLLVKELAPAGEGGAVLEAFLQRHMRRHNSFHSIYRAQRIVAPPREQWLARA